MARRRFRLLSALSLGTISLALVFSGCSVDMFSSGDDLDRRGSGRSGYRKIRMECSGLEIPSVAMDAATFKRLIACFNANDSLPEVAGLVENASQEDLQGVVNLLNDVFLGSPETLSESREVIRRLKAEGTWKPAIRGFAPLLNSPEALTALVQLLSSMEDDSGSIVRRSLLAAPHQEVMAGLELLGRVLGSPAYKNLLQKVRNDPLNEREKDLLIRKAWRLLKHPTPRSSFAELVDAFAAERNSETLAVLFPERDSEGLLQSISGLRGLIGDFSRNQGESLIGLARLHQAFHAEVSCWGGGKTFADPWRNLVEEIGYAARGSDFLSFMVRFSTTAALAVDGVCEVPAGFYSGFPVFQRLLRGPFGSDFHRVLESVFKTELGYSAGFFIGEWGEDLAEVLAALEKKPWFGDLLLVLAQFDQSDRSRIAEWVRSIRLNGEEWERLSLKWSEESMRGFFVNLGTALSETSSGVSNAIAAMQPLYEVSKNHPWLDAWKKILIGGHERSLLGLIQSRDFPRASKALADMADDGRLGDLLASIVEWVSGGGVSSQETVPLDREDSVKRALVHRWVSSDLLSFSRPLVLDPTLTACFDLDLQKRASHQWEVFQRCVGNGKIPDSTLAAIREASEWTLPKSATRSRSDLWQAFVQGWVDLPLSQADRRVFLLDLSSFFSKGREAFEGLADRMRNLRSKLFQPTAEEASPVVAIFDLVRRLGDEAQVGHSVWQKVFHELRSAVDDKRFTTTLVFLSGLQSPLDYDPSASAPYPGKRPFDRDSLVREILASECDRSQDANTRVAEVLTEFESSINGWDRVGGVLPTEWDRDALLAKLTPLLDHARSTRLRSGLYSWLGRYDAGELSKWFIERSMDARPVTLMGPDGVLYVRWMSTLDRLESILVNSDFSYLYPENHGIRFIRKFAEAWGDEPREAWPEEIKKRYRGRRKPPRLSEVNAEVRSFLNLFESTGGMPSIPPCAKKALGASWLSGPHVPKSVKVKAFNLRQTLSVIEENLPEANQVGMQILRDLFWEVHASGRTGGGEPLRFLQAIGDLGVLRALVRGAQTLSTVGDAMVVEDAVASLQSLVQSGGVDSVIASWLSSEGSVQSPIDRIFRSPEEFSSAIFFRNGLSVLAMDRTFGLLKAGAKSVAPIFKLAPFPVETLSDFVFESGKREGINLGLRTLRADLSRDLSAETTKVFIEERAKRIMSALPLTSILEAFERDHALRRSAFDAIVRLIGSNRQSNGGFHHLLSRSDAEKSKRIARALTLWLEANGADFMLAFSSRPTEAALILEGALRSLEGDLTLDFVDALFRQLPR